MKNEIRGKKQDIRNNQKQQTRNKKHIVNQVFMNN